MSDCLILGSGVFAASRRMRGRIMAAWFETAQERLLTMRTDSLPIDALDPRDHGLGAQLRDNSAEMLEVIDLEVDGQLGEVGRAARHADIVDIAVMLGDHGRNLGEAAGLVDVVNLDARRK